MGSLAGVYYYDRRQPAPQDAAQALGPIAQEPGNILGLHTAPGVLLAQISRYEDEPVRSFKRNAITWDGRLDNRGEIHARAGSRLPRDCSDAALALVVYEAAGSGAFRELIGDWSLALWDAASETLILASDYAGVRPLYFHRGEDGVRWSSSLAHLTRWAQANELDDDYMAGFLTLGAVVGCTPFRGVSPVPAGAAVRICAGRLSTAIFWTPPVGQTLRYADERDYETRLRGLFEEAVSARLGNSGPVCAELSGGLDSSAIVCMAHRILSRAETNPPALISFSHGHAASPDEKFYRAVERHCGLHGVHLDVGRYPFVSLSQLDGAAPAWWAPMHAEMARRAREAGSGVLLTGRIGDLVMGNWFDDSEQVAGLIKERRWSQAGREALAWSRVLHTPVYSILWRALRSNAGSFSELSELETGILTPRLRERARARLREGFHGAAWKHAPPARRKHFRGLAELLETRALQAPESLAELSYTHPYAHRPLVEFMLTIPASVACRPGEPRRLMRRAFAGLLPPCVLDRRSKATFNTVFLDALRPLAEQLLRHPRSSLLVELGYVDGAGLYRQLERMVQGLESGAAQLRQAILVEFWLRHRKLEPYPITLTYSEAPKKART